MLKIVGQLALNGAGPEVCRGVACDLYRILDIAGNELREGYRNMLADFLPAPDPEDLPGTPGEQADGEEKRNEE